MNKKELEKKKEQKRKEKLNRKENRKQHAGTKSFDDMIAYIDENGQITDTPPDRSKKQEIDIENIMVSTPRMEDIEEPELQGRVDYYNGEKGYGFIKDSDSANKYFFHINNAPPSIAEGNKVTYELEKGKKGMNAVNITII